MKKIAVIGYGYVGRAVANYFRDHYEVVIYDPHLSNDLVIRVPFDMKYAKDFKTINECDLAVVCVPTPEKTDHSVDISIIQDVLSWLSTPLILIKSTIPPGTTDDLIRKSEKDICFSPEFIGEGKYMVQWWKDKNYPHPTDMKYHDFHIVGGRRSTARKILEFFKKVSGPEPKYVVTDAKTAELCKYMENSWGATKVTFCNEFANIADKMGVDYDELRELWLLDGRVERMHTAVFKDNRGFGGKCYPKDVNGIVEQSKKAGYIPKLLETVLAVNDDIRKQNI